MRCAYSLRLRGEGLVWLIGAMVCLLAAPLVQLSVSAGKGGPHNALWHHWLMPISCHFGDCKALMVTSLTHVSGAMANVQTFTLPHRLRKASTEKSLTIGTLTNHSGAELDKSCTVNMQTEHVTDDKRDTQYRTKLISNKRCKHTQKVNTTC